MTKTTNKGKEEVSVGKVMLDSMPDETAGVEDSSPDTKHSPSSGSQGPSSDSQCPVDRFGRLFDQNLHIVNNDGTPLLTATGLLRVRRGQGIKKSGVGSPKGQSAIETVEAQHAACGVTTAELIFVMGVAIGGEDWLPENHERLYMQTAWTEYFRKKDIKDLPPGVLICTALVSYAIPRFGKPDTQTRMKRIGAWFKKRFSRKARQEARENYDTTPKSAEYISNSL